MSSLIGRGRAFRSSPHFKQILKFGSVSIISTIVSQAVLFLLYPHLIGSAVTSSVIATAVSTVPAYTLNRRWTWGKTGKSHLWREVLPFWVMAFIGLVLSTVIVGITAKEAHHFSHSLTVKVWLVHIAYIFSYALIWVGRYSILNRWLFGPSTQAPRDAIGSVAVEVRTAQAGGSATGSARTRSAR